MSLLLDTNILSELRKPHCDARVRAWFEQVGDDVFVSVLAIGEIRRGVELKRAKDKTAASVFDQWLAELLASYGDNILPVTTEIAEAWGKLSLHQPLPVVDGLMAATAQVHGLVFVTRNERDVARAGVRALNPFEFERAR